MIRMIKKAAAKVIMLIAAALALLLPTAVGAENGAGYRQFTSVGGNGGVERGGDTRVEKDTGSPRFIVAPNGVNGVVLDTTTKLMWTQDANIAGSWMKWNGAFTYLGDMNSSKHENFGFTDWRLPTRNELVSLLKSNQPYKWLNLQGFNNVQSIYYWSSTTLTSNADLAWAVFMGDGHVYYAEKARFQYFLWPVRGGQ